MPPVLNITKLVIYPDSHHIASARFPVDFDRRTSCAKVDFEVCGGRPPKGSNTQKPWLFSSGVAMVPVRPCLCVALLGGDVKMVLLANCKGIPAILPGIRKCGRSLPCLRFGHRACQPLQCLMNESSLLFTSNARKRAWMCINLPEPSFMMPSTFQAFGLSRPKRSTDLHPNSKPVEMESLVSGAKCSRSFPSTLGYSPLVLNAAMQAALNGRKYLEGARFFERLRRSNAPITLPVYPTALKLYGKLHDEGEVRKLWKELVHFEAVNCVVGQACIGAYADNGNITGAAEVLEYLENNSIQTNALHFTSAINACANSKENYRARAAKFLLEKLLEKGLQPSIVTYSCVVRSMQQSEGQELLDLVSNMTAQGVKANNVFAENFFYQFLKQPKKGSWTSKAAVVADLRKLPRMNLKRAKDVMNEFLAAGVELNASCRRIKAALESLL